MTITRAQLSLSPRESWNPKVVLETPELATDVKSEGVLGTLP